MRLLWRISLLASLNCLTVWGIASKDALPEIDTELVKSGSDQLKTILFGGNPSLLLCRSPFAKDNAPSVLLEARHYLEPLGVAVSSLNCWAVLPSRKNLIERLKLDLKLTRSGIVAFVVASGATAKQVPNMALGDVKQLVDFVQQAIEPVIHTVLKPSDLERKCLSKGKRCAVLEARGLDPSLAEVVTRIRRALADGNRGLTASFVDTTAFVPSWASDVQGGGGLGVPDFEMTCLAPSAHEDRYVLQRFQAHRPDLSAAFQSLSDFFKWCRTWEPAETSHGAISAPSVELRPGQKPALLQPSHSKTPSPSLALGSITVSHPTKATVVHSGEDLTVHWSTSPDFSGTFVEIFIWEWCTQEQLQPNGRCVLPDAGARHMSRKQEASSGKFVWTIPNAKRAGKYVVVVRCIDCHAKVEGIAPLERFFRISPPKSPPASALGSITVTRPDEMTKLHAGSNLDVTWALSPNFSGKFVEILLYGYCHPDRVTADGGCTLVESSKRFITTKKDARALSYTWSCPKAKQPGKYVIIVRCLDCLQKVEGAGPLMNYFTILSPSSSPQKDPREEESATGGLAEAGSPRTVPMDHATEESKDKPHTDATDESEDKPHTGSARPVPEDHATDESKDKMADDGGQASAHPRSDDAWKGQAATPHFTALSSLVERWTDRPSMLIACFIIGASLCAWKAWSKKNSKSSSSGPSGYNLGIENMITKVSFSSCSANVPKEELRAAGHKLLEPRVAKRNRILWRHRAKCMVFFLVVASSLLWVVSHLLPSMRIHDVPPLPSSEEFVLAGKNSVSFEAWGRQVFNVLVGEGAHLKLDITHTMRALGPVYTEEKRQCVKKKRVSQCRDLDREAYVVGAKGFEKGVFFLLAPPTVDIRAGTSLWVDASSTAKLLRSLQLAHKFKGKKNIVSLSTGTAEDSKVTFGEDVGMVLLPLALSVSVQTATSDTMVLTGFFVALFAGLSYIAYFMSRLEHHAATRPHHCLQRMSSRLANFILGHWGVLSGVKPFLADAADRYLGKLAKAERQNTIELQDRILEDIALSAQYGVLVEKGKTMLSQNWLIVGDRHGLRLIHVGIRTELSESDCFSARDHLIKGVDGTIPGKVIHRDVRGVLHSRLQNAHWQKLQIVRQLDCRSFLQCQVSGELYEFDAVTMFPSIVARADDIRQLLPFSATTISALPECPIVLEPCRHGLFLLPAGGKHFYSWDGFIQALRTKHQVITESTDIIFSGCKDADLLRIRDDPHRVPLCKSPLVDFGARERSLGALDGLLGPAAFLGEIMNELQRAFGDPHVFDDPARGF